MSKLISIIIPTFNRADLISDTLNSVLAQTYQDWECLVIDDGSTDNTENILEKFSQLDKRFKYHKRPTSEEKGANYCRNYGFSLSQGDYIQWFDDDDVMLEEFLQLRIDQFDANTDFVICSGYKVDNLLKNKKAIELKNTDNLYKDYALDKARVFTPSILFKKSFLKDKQLFLTSIMRGQETEFFLRLFYNINSNQYKIINVPLFMYRQHEATKSVQGKTYVPKFREDQTKIFIINLQRSIDLKDNELLIYFYQLLIRHFFLGIIYNHRKNSKLILKALIKHIGELNAQLKIELIILGNFLLLINKNSNSIRNRLKYHKSLKNLI